VAHGSSVFHANHQQREKRELGSTCSQADKFSEMQQIDALSIAATRDFMGRVLAFGKKLPRWEANCSV